VADEPTKRWWWQRQPRRAAGFVLVGLSIATMVAFAFVDSAKPATPTQSALFVVLGAGFQLAGAALFSREGRADPTHATSSFRHLGRLARKAAEAKQIAERAAQPDATVSVARRAIDRLSVDLSWIEEELVEAGEHWAQVHPELLPPDDPEARRTGVDGD